MMRKASIGIMVGSLRRESFSRKAALHLAGLLEGRFEMPGVRFAFFNDLNGCGIQLTEEI